MKTVKALVAFSNGVISMEQYEVRELPTDMANDLIAAGICVEAGGGSGGGMLMVGWTFHEEESGEVDGQPYVTPAYFELDKTWQEISDADIAILSVGDGRSKQIGVIEKIYKVGPTYKVDLRLAGEKLTFDTSASSDYPRRNAPQP